jgi:hypothetical protein
MKFSTKRAAEPAHLKVSMESIMQYAKHSSETVRRLFASWRGQPLDEIKRRIQCLRGAAAREHLTQEEWKTLDRMRKYVNDRERTRSHRPSTDST